MNNSTSSMDNIWINPVPSVSITEPEPKKRKTENSETVVQIIEKQNEEEGVDGDDNSPVPSTNVTESEPKERKTENSETVVQTIENQNEEEGVDGDDNSSDESYDNITNTDTGLDVEVKEFLSEETSKTTTEEVTTLGTVETTETVLSQSDKTGDVECVSTRTNESVNSGRNEIVQGRHEFFSAFHEYCVGGTTSLTTDEWVSQIQKDKDFALKWSTDDVNNHREELLSSLPDMSLILGGERRQFPSQMSPYEVYGAYIYLLTYFLQQHSPSIATTTRTDNFPWTPSPAFVNVSDPVFPYLNPFNIPTMITPMFPFPFATLTTPPISEPITMTPTYPCFPITPNTDSDITLSDDVDSSCYVSCRLER